MQYRIIQQDDLHLSNDCIEYATHLPFLYDHREEVYANPAYFYALLPYTIYGLKKATCIGAILKAFEKGEPYHIVSTDGTSEEFVAMYAGNPMTGTTSGWKTVVNNGSIEMQRFRICGFLSLVHRLAECFHETGFPYEKSSLTTHDVIQQLKEREADKDINKK